MTLLFDKHPLVINPTLASIIGLNEAIVLQQIHYWIELNKAANRNLKHGHTWTFNSYENWQEQFPFWSLSTIKRLFTQLKKRKLIITANYNKLSFDQTIWYRINYRKLTDIANRSPLCQNDTMQSVKMTPTIPETTLHEPSYYTNRTTRTIADQTSPNDP